MKVLLITDNHTTEGGAEKTVFELKARLNERAEFSVFSFGFAAKADKGEDFLVLPKCHSKSQQFFWGLFVNRKITKALENLIHSFQPDIIHLHNNRHYSASIFAALKGRKVVQTTHDYAYICPVAQNIHQDLSVCKQGFRWSCVMKHHVKHSLPAYFASLIFFILQRRRALQTVQQFIAPSPLLRDYLLKNNFNQVTFVPPFKISTPEYLASNLSEHFLFVGHFGIHKGILILLREFAQAVKMKPSLKLTMIGQGVEKNNIDQFIIENGLANNVIVKEWQSDLSSYYQQCTAVIFPSIGLESFGMVMTEAMTHGRPVIGCNRGTVPWLVNDGETGLLFDPVVQGDFAEKILRLADGCELAQKLGENAYRKMQTLFDNEVSLERIIGVYNSCFNNC